MRVAAVLASSRNAPSHKRRLCMWGSALRDETKNDFEGDYHESRVPLIFLEKSGRSKRPLRAG